MNKLTLLDKVSGILTYILFVLSFWYVTWALLDLDDTGNLLQGITNQWYFTNQTNTLVVITTVLFWSRFEKKPWFKYLSSIVLVNIIITATGYHFILENETVSFYSHLSHTIVPILYVIFYFIAVRNPIKLSMFWVNIMYPMIYLGLVLILRTFPLGSYPYPFLNIEVIGLMKVLSFTLLRMLPGYTFVAFLMTYLKTLFEKKLVSNN
jgi:hypothetical protein